MEPHLGPGATGGMIVPDEHIIDPWSTPLAFAYEAVANGASSSTNHAGRDCVRFGGHDDHDNSR